MSAQVLGREAPVDSGLVPVVHRDDQRGNAQLGLAAVSSAISSISSAAICPIA